MIIQQLGLSQLEKLYYTHMQKDFVPKELRPWHSVKRLTEQGSYTTFACKEGDQLLAYAAFAQCQGVALLDYFAVVPQLRGQGVGSRFFQELKEVAAQFDAPCVLIEVESLESATSPEEREIRRRRIQFYKRCGCGETGIFAFLFGVEYEILALPLQEKLTTQEELEKSLDRMYHRLIPPLVGPSEEKFSQVCRVYRRDKAGI